MHRFWNIVELQEAIFAACTPRAALLLGLTSKCFLEAALDRVWSQVQLECLVECLPPDIWHKWEDWDSDLVGHGWYWHQKRSLSQAEFDRILYYSRRVHEVTLGWEKWIDGSFFHSPNGKQPSTLLPQLRSASFYLSNPARRNEITETIDLRLFLRKSVTSMTLNISRVLSTNPTGPYKLFISELASRCPNLHQLRFRVDERESSGVSGLISQTICSCHFLQSVEVLKQHYGIDLVLSRQVLQYLADLETLTELVLPFVDFPPDHKFSKLSLRRLHVRSLGQHSLSGLKNLVFLRVENVLESKKADISPASLSCLKHCWVSGDRNFCVTLVIAAEGAPLTSLTLRMGRGFAFDEEIPLAQMLASIGQSSTLEQLTLKGSARPFHVVGQEDFLALRRCSMLTQLKVKYDLRLDDADWDSLLPCWPNLKILKLGWRNYGNTSLRVFETVARYSLQLVTCHMPFRANEVPELEDASTALPAAKLVDIITMNSELEADAEDVAKYFMALFPRLESIAIRLRSNFCSDDYTSWYEKVPMESDWDEVQYYLDER
ncbi:hypothetical protein DL96DRAFT_1677316 [Flagelloscypha sp. PMI_526]|nr:hypothetical protein DL96DRAFT_1677316 [Flagelloscypha sp. PMI_526]